MDFTDRYILEVRILNEWVILYASFPYLSMQGTFSYRCLARYCPLSVYARSILLRTFSGLDTFENFSFHATVALWQYGNKTETPRSLRQRSHIHWQLIVILVAFAFTYFWLLFIVTKIALMVSYLKFNENSKMLNYIKMLRYPNFEKISV